MVYIYTLALRQSWRHTLTYLDTYALETGQTRFQIMTLFGKYGILNYTRTYFCDLMDMVDSSVDMSNYFQFNLFHLPLKVYFEFMFSLCYSNMKSIHATSVRALVIDITLANEMRGAPARACHSHKYYT